ncbi:hypothetical protein [Enterococcus cecorum]|uniref:hypothetical protein n=1 Tax=Enterococcus cecorum TaxID=44008 RepID=UPI0019643605|nr:hypothetical protein [Enterococcus cecorum]
MQRIEQLGQDYIEYQNNYVYRRLYNPKTGSHIYEKSEGYTEHYIKNGYCLEKGSLLVNKATFLSKEAVPVYDIYNSRTEMTLYTSNLYERDLLLSLNPKNYTIQPIWYVNAGFYGVPANQGIPVYRLYNPNSWRGTHHFTPIQAEKDMLVRLGWRYEGIGFYVSGVLNE